MKFYIIIGYPAIKKYERMTIMARTKWREEFDRVSKEHNELLRTNRKEQLRKLAMELVLNLDNESWLRSVVIIMARLQDKELKDEYDNYSIVTKDGVIND